jgi:hypothetical protein
MIAVSGALVFAGYQLLTYGWSQLQHQNVGFFDLLWPGRLTAPGYTAPAPDGGGSGSGSGSGGSSGGGVKPGSKLGPGGIIVQPYPGYTG